jgi:DNA polymerase-3 subunit alpha
LADKGIVRLAGIIRSIKVIRTKKEELMAFVTVEDMFGSVEVVIFPGIYAEVGDLLVEDNPVFVQGEVQKEEKGIKVLAQSIIAVDKAEEKWTATIHIRLDLAKVDRELLLRLKGILDQYPGGCRGYLHLQLPDAAETVIAMSPALGLRSCAALRREINAFLGYDAVKTACRAAVPVERSKGENGQRRKRPLRKVG